MKAKLEKYLSMNKTIMSFETYSFDCSYTEDFLSSIRGKDVITDDKIED